MKNTNRAKAKGNNNVNATEIQLITTSRQRMEAATSISTATRKWLVALGMTQDIREYCRISQKEIENEGYPIRDHDKELLDAVKGLQSVINKYLNEQINMSILGIGEENVCETAQI